MTDEDYKECADCASKPGSPTLCESCLHNRRVVGELQREVRRLQERVRVIKLALAAMTKLAEAYDNEPS